jgi:signal transduction histidine kinase/ligand-binding sensor domain-containing protein
MKHPPIPRPGWLLLICLVALLDARAERLPVKIFTSADGLGSSFVDNVFRDSRGFMWFCTRDGLSRFDGARFITYRIGDKNAPPGIEGIYQTGAGSYWITTTGGLYYFRADALTRVEPAGGGRPFLNAQYIDESRGSFMEDDQGNVWYMGLDLYRAYERNGKVEWEKKPLNLPLNPNRPFVVFQARRAPDGSFWINTNQGLIRRTPDGRIIMLEHDTDKRLGSVSLMIDRSGLIWVGWGLDIYILRPPPIEALPPDQFSARPLAPGASLELKPDQKYVLPKATGDILHLTKKSAATLSLRLYQTADGHVWICSNDDLLEFDGNSFHFYDSSQGLPLGMSAMAEDAAGNLWISSRTGAARWDRKGLTSFGVNDGLKSPAIFAINEDSGGDLYFANGDFYLSRFGGQRFETVHPQIQPDAQALWSSRYAFLSSADEWWILTSDKLYRFAASNLQNPLAIYDKNYGLATNHSFQIFEDSRGDIWLSQQPSRMRDYGLYRLRRGENQFYRFSTAENFPAEKSASSFAEDRNGNLWFGFYEGGLARFANNRFEQFDANDGLASSLITDLHLDQKGRLWLASAFAGLQRIDDPAATRPAFNSLTIDEGLSSNNVRTITEDNLGNIYAGTVRGVDRISPDGQIRHYSVNDGLAGDFVVDSHRDRTGALWFATTNGLSRLMPSSEEGHAPPKILLSGLRIAGENQPVSELGDTEIRKGDLSATRNNLQIDFFGLNFRPGEALRYQFMLEGADSNWSAPSEQRTVTYANLKAGSYRFLVRAISAGGAVSERPAVVSFKILPPIWLRWWFLTFATLLTIALLYLFYRYRMGHLREVNAALDEARRAGEDLSQARADRLTELGRVRTRIATDLHDDIGASLTQIAILSEVVRQQNMQSNGAGLEPLNSIVNVSNELVETMSDIVWAINPEKDRLQDLIQRMRRFASDLLTAKGVQLEFNAPTDVLEVPLGANARREVFLIFKESLTNIARHAGATLVKINFDMSPEALRLSIADNGHGFDVEARGAARAAARSKGGHGIFSMKKRAAELNGRLDIRSAFGQGTIITFQVPLDAAARRARLPTTQLGGNN